MVVQVIGFLIAVVLIMPPCALGAVFYLDPDVSGGTQVGTQANPFNTLDASAWMIINHALAIDDVTVYCSARNAGTDTNQLWNAQVDLTRKTPNPTGTLTFDGKSFWNSSDTTPNWSAYTGTSRCQMFGFVAESVAHTKYSKVTIDGFVVQNATSANQFGFGILLGAGTAGSHILNNIIQNNIAGISLANNSTLNQTVIGHNLIQNNNQAGPISGTGIYSDQFNAGGTLTGPSPRPRCGPTTEPVAASPRIATSRSSATDSTIAAREGHRATALTSRPRSSTSRYERTTSAAIATTTTRGAS